MRNLKKILALVLALVMSLSLITIAGAKEYKDVTKDTKYANAIQNLTNYDVLQGRTSDTFDPSANIRRSEVAAILYRVMTGDTSDSQVSLYVSSATKQFKDVPANHWAAGYIGFCASQGVVVGMTPNKFDPDANVTGYQALTMILRAIGYDKTKEFQGNGYEKPVAAKAAELGITRQVASAELPGAATRALVAELIYQGATYSPRVSWTPSTGYQYVKEPTNLNAGTTGEEAVNTTLIEQNATSHTYNIWGDPTTVYSVEYTWPAKNVSRTYDSPDTPLYTFYGAMTECDLADAIPGFGDGTQYATTRTNGRANVDVNSYNNYTDTAAPQLQTSPIRINALNTTTKVGHEGRVSRVYLNPTGTSPKYLIVGVDTFLGVVTATHETTYDTAGHVVKAAYADVSVVYNAAAVDQTYSAASPLSLEVSGSNFTVGQKLGLNIATATGLLTQTHRNIMSATNTNANYNPSKTGAQVEVANALTATTVTIKGILRDSTSGAASHIATQPVGFTGTNGVTYYYNYTFGKTPLTAANIGQTYTVWTDSYGNVLDYQLTSFSAGYGVTLNAVYKMINTDAYVVTYTILLPDGTQTTIDVQNAATHKPYTQAEITATPSVVTSANTLVHFVSAGSYYEFDQAQVINGGNPPMIESGRAGALTVAYTNNPVIGDNNVQTDGTLVNNDTVFFVANYMPNVTTTTDANDYIFTGYSIYSGFQNIPDLAREANSTTTTGSNGATSAANARVIWQAFDVNPVTGAPEPAAAGAYAKYVLVLNATKQTNPPAKINTVNYAFITSDDTVVEEGATSYTFPAVINGQKTNLQVALNAGGDVDTIGLYTYGQYINGQGYSGVYMLNGSDNTSLAMPYNQDFELDKATYTYSAGVLTVSATGTPNPAYYTVADGCAVYIVNPTNGNVNASSLSALSLYGAGSNIWYQLNEYGRINLIYIVESNL